MENRIIKSSRTLTCAVLLAPLLLAAGCSVEATEEGATEETATTSQALGGTFTKNGFTVKWTKVGQPWAADKIAACGPTIWAMNDDKTLWENRSGGSDSGWTRKTTLPSKAKSLACTWGTVYYLDTDQKLYRAYEANLNSWTYMNTPGSAQHIASGGNEIYALNYDKKIYDGDASSNGTWGGWSYRGTASSADRVTGGDAPDDDHRAFALNLNNSLW